MKYHKGKEISTPAQRVLKPIGRPPNPSEVLERKLTMHFENYTQKSLEAVQSAQRIAVSNSHQQMEQVHLLLALLQQDGGLVPQLLKKMELPAEALEAAAMTELRKLPAVKTSREAERFYISADMDAAFTAAANQAAAMRDDYVSVEHLFLGLLETARGGTKHLLDTYRITREAVLKALQSIRLCRAKCVR